MAELITGLTPERVAANLAAVDDQIAAACARAGRSVDTVRTLAAVKYVAEAEMPVLSQAGITLAGENRAQQLVRKASLAPELEWHFIGHLQSRKVRDVVPHVTLIHSVCTESVVTQLERHAPPGTAILVEVNISGEEGKSGVAPAELGDFIAACRERARADVRGLMTMPPLADDAEQSRPWFAALAALGAEHGLGELSMGTTQDFTVAVEEGATIVRIGSRLYT